MSADTEVHSIDIIVTGVAEVGKTAFIKTISPKLDNRHAQGWLTGSVQLDAHWDANFYEPPATYKFDYHWQREMIEQSEVSAYIVVCDSTRPETFGEMIGILETIRAFHPATPCILAATKQDLYHAWGAEDIRIALCIPDEIPVMPCIGGDVDLVGAVVIRLLEMLWAE